MFVLRYAYVLICLYTVKRGPFGSNLAPPLNKCVTLNILLPKTSINYTSISSVPSALSLLWDYHVNTGHSVKFVFPINNDIFQYKYVPNITPSSI